MNKNTNPDSQENKNEINESNALMPRKDDDPLSPAPPKPHIYGKKKLCSSDSLGYKTPHDMTPLDIVLDASEGFIPLWAENVNLRWRFDDESFTYFQNPSAAKRAIRQLFSEAVSLWGDSSPIGFTERNDAWDFEIVMRPSANCSINGCTLASAFFPDPGRHELVLYPTMFEQVKDEQVETLIHEIGHIFGLRHFFANISETRWASEIFGDHKSFSIMNYGEESQLTDTDKSNLNLLYQKVWSGELTKINGTQIVQVTPFHELNSKR